MSVRMKAYADGAVSARATAARCRAEAEKFSQWERDALAEAELHEKRARGYEVTAAREAEYTIERDRIAEEDEAAA